MYIPNDVHYMHLDKGPLCVNVRFFSIDITLVRVMSTSVEHRRMNRTAIYKVGGVPLIDSIY